MRMEFSNPRRPQGDGYSYARSIMTISPEHGQSSAFLTNPARTGILPDVIPFLRVAFIAAQKMIEKPPLPDWRFRSWMLDLLCEVLFQHADPASQLEVIGSTDE